MIAIDDHDVVVHEGDARDVLAQLPAGSAQCIVTSPPYSDADCVQRLDEQVHALSFCKNVRRDLKPTNGLLACARHTGDGSTTHPLFPSRQILTDTKREQDIRLLSLDPEVRTNSSEQRARHPVRSLPVVQQSATGRARLLNKQRPTEGLFQQSRNLWRHLLEAYPLGVDGCPSIAAHPHRIGGSAYPDGPVRIDRSGEIGG